MTKNELIQDYEDKLTEYRNELIKVKHTFDIREHKVSDMYERLILKFIEDLKNLPNELKGVSNNEQKQEFCCICGCEVVDVETYCEECSSKKHSTK